MGGHNDLKILVKRSFKRNHLPYRELDINWLGAVSPLKPLTKPLSEDSEEIIESDDEDKYETPKKQTRRRGFVEKPMIFRRINSFLDGYDPMAVESNNHA